ncbi:MAG: hypothetical protein ACK56L_08210, partial [Pseudanabaena sp.]
MNFTKSKGSPMGCLCFLFCNRRGAALRAATRLLQCEFYLRDKPKNSNGGTKCRHCYFWVLEKLFAFFTKARISFHAMFR